jgi:hypothetical protein
MVMIDYNELATVDRRSKAKPLSIKEEYKVIDILNERAKGGSHKKLTKAQKNLLQRFVDNYQNLKHALKKTNKLNVAAK